MVDVSICSVALVLIGDNSIQHFADTTGGLTAKELWYPFKKNLLGEYPWPFSKKTERLNVLSEAPDEALGYSYKLQIPIDCIDILRVISGERYDIYADGIYSNCNDVLLEFLADVEVNKFSTHLEQAAIFGMAAMLAWAIPHEKAMSDSYQEKYLSKLTQAKAKASQSRPSRGFTHSPFTDCR